LTSFKHGRKQGPAPKQPEPVLGRKQGAATEQTRPVLGRKQGPATAFVDPNAVERTLSNNVLLRTLALLHYAQPGQRGIELATLRTVTDARIRAKNIIVTELEAIASDYVLQGELPNLPADPVEAAAVTDDLGVSLILAPRVTALNVNCTKCVFISEVGDGDTLPLFPVRALPLSWFLAKGAEGRIRRAYLECFVELVYLALVPKEGNSHDIACSSIGGSLEVDYSVDVGSQIAIQLAPGVSLLNAAQWHMFVAHIPRRLNIDDLVPGCAMSEEDKILACWKLHGIWLVERLESDTPPRSYVSVLDRGRDGWVCNPPTQGRFEVASPATDLTSVLLSFAPDHIPVALVYVLEQSSLRPLELVVPYHVRRILRNERLLNVAERALPSYSFVSDAVAQVAPGPIKFLPEVGRDVYDVFAHFPGLVHVEQMRRLIAVRGNKRMNKLVRFWGDTHPFNTRKICVVGKASTTDFSYMKSKPDQFDVLPEQSLVPPEQMDDYVEEDTVPPGSISLDSSVDHFLFSVVTRIIRGDIVLSQ
jgi:hypothetical protein